MNVDSVWEYNAPQFVDFSRPMEDDPGVDEYFDIDHEGENVLKVEGTSELSSAGEIADAKPERNDTESCAEPHVNKIQINQEIGMKTCKDAVAAPPKPSCIETAKSADKGTELQPELSTELTTRMMRSKAGVLCAAAETCAKTENDPVNAEASNSKIPSNLCSSIEQWKAKTAGKTRSNKISNSEVSKMNSQEPIQLRSRRSNTEKRAEEVSAATTGHLETDMKPYLRPRTRSLDRGKQAHPNQNVSSQSSSGAITAVAASNKISQSQERVGRQASPCDKDKKTYVGKLTMPCTPSFMKREMKFLHLNQVKNSEAQEMDKIRELRRALAEKRKMASESRVVALSAAGYEPMRSKVPVTRPEEFQFASDARLKGPPVETGQASRWKEVDFAAELRKHSDQPVVVPHGPTVPQPFNLHTSKKRNLSGDNYQSDEGKFETMAEKLMKFSSKTPDRFRTKPAIDRRSAGNQVKKSAEQGDFRLTVPKTPNLVTKTRARPANILSQADLEEIELEEIKKNQFKAQPLNQKIFENPIAGIKKVVPKGCTVPESFDLEIERRLEQRKRHHSESTDEPRYEFHAQPLPKKMLLGPVGVKPAKEIALTVPQSPAFATKYLLRSSHAKEEAQAEKEPAAVKAHPVLHTGIPFQPKLDHRVTVIEPFSFEERTKEMLAKKEDHIRKVLEEEKKAREFHAQPLKDLQPVLPERKPKPPTTPEPFNLGIEARCAARLEDWKHKVDEETKKLKATAAFKAKPPIVLEREPFVPARSAKLPTEMTDIPLHTEKRAEKRLEWEAWNNEKATELAYERMEYEKAKMTEQEREIQRLRAGAVSKANPIRQYKPVQILPSDQPLTNPESPRFSERLTAKMLRH